MILITISKLFQKVTLIKGLAFRAKLKLHKNATSYIEQIREATSHNTVSVRLPTSHL